jgi:hypothetical protein
MNEYEIGQEISVYNMVWICDWKGHEVGHDDILIIGYYTKDNLNFHIDMENMILLEIWDDEE